MSGEMKATFRIVELAGGGFILAEEMANGDFDAVQAVSTLDEASGALQRRLRDWHQECRRLRVAEIEDESRGAVIAPRRWWRNA